MLLIVVNFIKISITFYMWIKIKWFRRGKTKVLHLFLFQNLDSVKQLHVFSDLNSLLLYFRLKLKFVINISYLASPVSLRKPIKGASTHSSSINLVVGGGIKYLTIPCSRVRFVWPIPISLLSLLPPHLTYAPFMALLWCSKSLISKHRMQFHF